MKAFIISIATFFVVLMAMAIGGSVYLQSQSPEKVKEIFSTAISGTKTITQNSIASSSEEHTGFGLFLDIVKLLLLLTLFAIVSSKLLSDWGISGGSNDEDK